MCSVRRFHHGVVGGGGVVARQSVSMKKDSYSAAVKTGTLIFNGRKERNLIGIDWLEREGNAASLIFPGRGSTSCPRL